MFSLLRRLRRRRLARRPFPAEWRAIVDERLPFVARFDDDERARFLTRLQVFALEKSWEGAHGLVVTDEMKVVVSASAARLGRNLPLDVYDDLTSIVLYESHFQPPGREGVTYGEAHAWGVVVLSWDAVKHGIGNPGDGHDTALHEFAHVLDHGDGGYDGTPTLHDAADYRAWTTVFSAHYFALVKKPHQSVLRAYGATNEAEFFAVATEAFFEKPVQLAKKAPDLYAELRRYYRVDPAALLARAA